MAKVKHQRKYLLAITICGGIITLIDDNGNVVCYRQRGIKRLTDYQRKVLISKGFLQRNWEQFKELPSNVSIYFEDEDTMGKARATYPNPEEIIKALTGK